MTERKEKTMLKWLKQKPSSLHSPHPAIPIEKITDDPLATIQVHPQGAKKSKNKANEIYAVSRVNPLFEEEEIPIPKEVFSPGGNSGSSGYDSGSGPSDDDFPILQNVVGDLKELNARLQLDSPVVATATVKPSHLFINTENDIIQESAIVGPNGHPILQILEQNPAYVKSIALNIGRKRPLSPISEGQQILGEPPPLLYPPPPPLSPQAPAKYNLSTSGSLANAKRYPISTGYTTIDSIGAAKLVKKDSQYVRSIRIGGPTNFGAATKRSILEANRRYSSGSSSSSNIPSRRPSVTFADDVGGSRSSSRKPSMEQDSIVTESLLMMTTMGATDHPLIRRFSNASSSSSSGHLSRKTSVSSSSKAESTASSEIPVDLQQFANSLRKSRPIKQLSSSGRSHTSSSSDDLEPPDLPPDPPQSPRISTLDRPAASPPMSPTPRLHATKKSHKSPFGGIADHYAAAKEIAKEIESYSNGSAKASTKKSLVRDLLYRGNRNANGISNDAATNALKISGASNSNAVPLGNPKHSPREAIYVPSIFRRDQGVPGNPGRETRPHSNLLLQTVEAAQVVAQSPPIYYETASPYGGGTSTGKIGSSRRAPSSRPTSPPIYSPGGGASADWELVRVQQVYVKTPTPEAQERHVKKDAENATISSRASVVAAATSSSSAAAAAQGQEHATNSRRHPVSSKIPTATASSSRGKSGKKVPSSGDDGLRAGARSRLQNDDTSDSGNSSDRTYAEVRLEIEGTRLDLPEGPHDARIQVEDDASCVVPENLPSKVMIVTGDSQNIVVDLSGVPLDLKNAIVSGTALITLPDGLDKMLQPGYTMITIPASNATSTSTTSRPPTTLRGEEGVRSSSSKKEGVGGGGNVTTLGKRLGDDDKPLVTTSGHSSDDECRLFASKNKAQIWDVIQQTVGKNHDGGGGGKGKKKITTIFPFHPNQDAYESPDFTIEGHRLDRQRKKVDQEKKRRCACRLCGMLFFLLAFLGVLVALSMIYTRGQRYFGSSV